jgi:hypothetical protein
MVNEKRGSASLPLLTPSGNVSYLVQALDQVRLGVIRPVV